ncbi:hypothetical protein J1N35_007119 [Gossypium stocksii]|uniref:Cyanobacterial aminoacyl-tRNA synthetase CAAD domain-containing protein n=1 Tax=Gossypium stocksii TaxID=47602 RepID=A0A9D3W613_9ROSI|nr:hypothetical protein J1N35_007119 [Gossypium stocksii]
MELSRSLTPPISPLPTISFFAPHPSFRPHLRPLPPSRTTAYCLHSRVLCFNNNHLLKAKASKETSDGEAALEEVAAVEKNVYDEKLTVEKLKEEPLAFQFSEKLNIKLDLEDAYSITLYGSGTVVALCLASALVGAVDSIPLFPKFMEIVGLGYTCWFSSRYLLFKDKSRSQIISFTLTVSVENAIGEDLLASCDENENENEKGVDNSVVDDAGVHAVNYCCQIRHPFKIMKRNFNIPVIDLIASDDEDVLRHTLLNNYLNFEELRDIMVLTQIGQVRV